MYHQCLQNQQCWGRRCWSVVVVLLVLLCCYDLAHAFEVNKDAKGKTLRWPTMPISWELNPGAIQGVTSGDLENVFKQAFQKWQNIKCAKLTFLYRGLSTKYQNRTDKSNVISFPANFEGKYGKGILFNTNYAFDNNGNLTDIDVELNPQINWAINPQSSAQDLESVAVVVAGHIMGLATSKVQGASMYGQFLGGDISKRSLHPDDIAGVCALYQGGGPQCSTTPDCGSVDLECQGGQCVLAKNTQALAKVCKPCSSVGDCDADMACDLINNTTYCLQLCSPDGLCPPNYSCNGSGVGAQCLPTAGLCAATACQSDSDCAGGFLCKQGKCVPECQVDSDCPATKPRCLSGKCGTAGSCSRDLDCSAGEVCKNQKCEPSGKSCTQDSECSAGEKCVQSRCQLVTPCSSDNDCPANHACKQGFCQRTNTQCQPGATQSCACSAGGSGTQTCDSSGQWGACQNCGGNKVCTAGQSQKCACTGGSDGTQVCANDGTRWESCQCAGGCNPGATQACSCSGGGSGTQTCDANKQWGACQGCGGNKSCVPGATQQCACVGGTMGAQTCATDGSRWEPCLCDGPSTCTPGSTQQCFCPGNTQGAQTCATDGTRWESCQCGTNSTGSETTSSPDGGDPVVGKCETHGQCPANQICVRGLCSSQQPGGTGCSCETAPSSPGLWLLLLLGLVSLWLVVKIPTPGSRS